MVGFEKHFDVCVIIVIAEFPFCLFAEIHGGQVVVCFEKLRHRIADKSSFLLKGSEFLCIYEEIAEFVPVYIFLEFLFPDRG